jgi:anti-anti-sigma factor
MSDATHLSRGAVVVTLTGRIDLSLVRRLHAVLDRALAEHDNVRMDLSELRSIDSTGIRELLRAQALAARNRKSFGVTTVSPNAFRILDRADARGLLLEPECTD